MQIANRLHNHKNQYISTRAADAVCFNAGVPRLKHAGKPLRQLCGYSAAYGLCLVKMKTRGGTKTDRHRIPFRVLHLPGPSWRSMWHTNEAAAVMQSGVAIRKLLPPCRAHPALHLCPVQKRLQASAFSWRPISDASMSMCNNYQWAVALEDVRIHCVCQPCRWKSTALCSSGKQEVLPSLLFFIFN